jgi:uncharacterized damage-inducible protein DinB
MEKKMDISHIRLLYAYNQWANERILDRAEKLTPEQLCAPNDGSFGSIHDTLVHLMETEFFWSGLIWPGKAINIDWEPFEFSPDDYPDVAAIRARWAEITTDLFAFIDGLTPAGENGLERTIVWQSDVWHSDAATLRRRTLWTSMLDVIIHATQHRSEMAMALTRYGYSPGELDLSVYMGEQAPETTAE